ncbi:unnamed protein product [Clavelina lepadiformis]|uniref:Uncharacterized protein n=1 Tax=Clavelina lepadiformis TaxID=159417 RepID=A0ABP0GCF5_CLALP
MQRQSVVENKSCNSIATIPSVTTTRGFILFHQSSSDLNLLLVQIIVSEDSSIECLKEQSCLTVDVSGCKMTVTTKE